MSLIRPQLFCLRDIATIIRVSESLSLEQTKAVYQRLRGLFQEECIIALAFHRLRSNAKMPLFDRDMAAKSLVFLSLASLGLTRDALRQVEGALRQKDFGAICRSIQAGEPHSLIVAFTVEYPTGRRQLSGLGFDVVPNYGENAGGTTPVIIALQLDELLSDFLTVADKALASVA